MKKNILLAALLPSLLGACGHGYLRTENPAINQPLDVRPTRTGNVLVSNGKGAVTTPEGGWVSMATVYARRGRGSVRIEGTPADIRTTSRQLQSAGIPPDAIVAVSHPRHVEESNSVVVSWPSYDVRLPECGDFSSDREEFFTDFYHSMSSNFGCSQRRNLGMMLSDPGDLVASRGVQPPSIATGSHSIGRVQDYGVYERPPTLSQTGGTQGGR